MDMTVNNESPDSSTWNLSRLNKVLPLILIVLGLGLLVAGVGSYSLRCVFDEGCDSDIAERLVSGVRFSIAS